MKLLLISPILYLSLTGFLQNIPRNPNPNNIRQANGTHLSIMAKGTMFIPYTETTDGYVIVKNEKSRLYEYAVADSTGNLVVSGIKAHDTGKRTNKEKAFLKRNKKHLQYSGTKLKELEERAERDKKNVQ